MKEWQKRVIVEQKDLQTKIGKLEDFLGDYNKRLIPKHLPAEYSLLCNQLEVMLKYNEFLLDRIKLHKNFH